MFRTDSSNIHNTSGSSIGLLNLQFDFKQHVEQTFFIINRNRR